MVVDPLFRHEGHRSAVSTTQLRTLKRRFDVSEIGHSFTYEGRHFDHVGTDLPNAAEAQSEAVRLAVAMLNQDS